MDIEGDWQAKDGDLNKCCYAHSAPRQSYVGPCELSQVIGIMTQLSVAGVSHQHRDMGR